MREFAIFIGNFAVEAALLEFSLGWIYAKYGKFQWRRWLGYFFVLYIIWDLIHRT